MKLNKILCLVSIPFGIIFILLIVANIIVLATPSLRFQNIEDLPNNQPCLVLGTSKYFKSGKLNFFYIDRMQAAAQAFKFHKCSNFVLSGGDRSETIRMRRSLMALGVSKDVIVQDNKGYRTIHSIRNFKNIYGYQKGIVISQGFHNQRALYLAKQENLDMIGFDAQEQWQNFGSYVLAREVLGRARAVWDVYFTDSSEN